MRPLQRPPIPETERVGRPATALLLNAFGPYCSLSERPVLDAAHAWHVGRNEEVVEVETREDWEQVLLLDPATLAAVQASGGASRSELRLPDRDLTFSLPGEPLFRYSLEDVSVAYLDDEGNPTGDPVTEPLVIVSADDPAALRTIEVFALNTPYFDADRGELRIPRALYLARVDHRVHHRTEAWARAEQMAALVADADNEIRAPLLDQARHVAAATGFWSVWATVFWARFEDPELVRRVLVEPPDRIEGLLSVRREAGLAAAAHHLGPGSHHAFPGTRADAIGG